MSLCGFTEQFKVLLLSLKSDQNNLGADGERGKEKEREDDAKKFVRQLLCFLIK